MSATPKHHEILARLQALHAPTQADPELALRAMLDELSDIPVGLLGAACNVLIREPGRYRVVPERQWSYCPSVAEIRRTAAIVSRISRGLPDVPWNPTSGAQEPDYTREIASWGTPAIEPPRPVDPDPEPRPEGARERFRALMQQEADNGNEFARKHLERKSKMTPVGKVIKGIIE